MKKILSSIILGYLIKNETREFNISRVNSAWSTLHPNKEGIKLANYYKTKIKLKRFDSLNISIENPCFLKINVEGHEYQVLLGFGDELKNIDCIQIEYDLKRGVKLSRILSLLEKYGFNYIIQHDLRKDVCDFIFLKTELEKLSKKEIIKNILNIRH